MPGIVFFKHVRYLCYSKLENLSMNGTRKGITCDIMEFFNYDTFYVTVGKKTVGNVCMLTNWQDMFTVLL